jgi:DNA-binding transcriptional LysR family regulator
MTRLTGSSSFGKIILCITGMSLSDSLSLMISRSVDLNLLVPLSALLEERSVTRAADRLHLSQPGVSVALGRLRRHFNDELLHRTGNSYELTPLATQLLDRVHSASLGLDRVFGAQSEFDPATSTREFSLFSSDYATAMIGNALATAISEVAPRVRVQFSNILPSIINSAPESIRDHDGMLVPHGYLRDSPHQDLFLDRWVCVIDAANTQVGEHLSLHDLATLPWVSSFDAQTELTPPAQQMRLLGIEPRVQIGSPGFLAIPQLIRGTDRIALIQETYARQLAPGSHIRVLECPFEVVPFREAFWWNPIYTLDPEHIWFRSMLPVAVRRAGLVPAESEGP